MELNRKSYEGIAVFIAICSLIAAIVGIIIQLRAEKKRELTCNVLSSNELTSVSTVPGLTSRFTYNNKEVVHLWKISVSLVNSGSDTLIGQGPHTNLMSDRISFTFPDNAEILNLEVTYRDMEVTVTSTGPTEVSKQATSELGQANAEKQPNKFLLKFGQWRPGERVEVLLYVAALNSQPSNLVPSSPSRDIVDGNIVVRSLLSGNDQKKGAFIDRLPAAVRITVKVVLSLVCLIVAPFGMIMPKYTLDGLRWAIWKKKNLREYSKYVEGLSGISDFDRGLYAKKPFTLPKELWSDYPGDKPGIPATSITSLSDLPGAMGFSLVAIAAAIYVLTNVLDLLAAGWAHLAG